MDFKQTTTVIVRIERDIEKIEKDFEYKVKPEYVIVGLPNDDE